MTIKKIVIIGPESTGKSTLSSMLSEVLHTVWVPEFAREYLEGLGRDYNYNDLEAIAKGQLALEKKRYAQANNYLICDTDLQVIKVWSEHKYGKCADYILQNIAATTHDLYLLTDIDMPWVFDPLREHPDENMRRYFFDIYKDIVANSGSQWQLVSGNERQRLEMALTAINQLQ